VRSRVGGATAHCEGVGAPALGALPSLQTGGPTVTVAVTWLPHTSHFITCRVPGQALQVCVVPATWGGKQAGSAGSAGSSKKDTAGQVA